MIEGSGREVDIFDTFLRGLEEIGKKHNLAIPKVRDHHVAIPKGGGREALVEVQVK